jgi:hypothetical protein
MPIPHWMAVLNHLAIMFEERVPYDELIDYKKL